MFPILTRIVDPRSDTFAWLTLMNEPRLGAVSSRDDEPLGNVHVIRGGHSEPAPYIPRRGRVLIVDDSVHTREVYAMYLNAVGYDARTASNGEEAVVLAGVITPDVIVMDLVLPGISGNTAARLLKLDPRTRRIPVILLTGHPERAIQGRALERGVDDFLTKPCLPNDLEGHVRRLIDKRPRST